MIELKNILSFRAVVAITILLASASCKKDEGQGGQATITGKVMAHDVDFSDTTSSGYIAGVRVYISYGENTGVDDDTRTSYDGTYSFKWLQKGSYKVWVVSECSTCPLNQSPDVAEVDINETKETKTVRDLIYVY